MSGGIYLLKENDELIEMSEQQYDSEQLLQALLARYPNLLAGEQINSSEPRRWLLISREEGIPDREEAGARWAVDHLFLDQDGIPTLVEVKRSSDTRIRREVLGQMLDYAANARTYWSAEKIRAKFEAECEQRKMTPTERMSQELLTEADHYEDYWETVKTNLEVGKLRMVFVADVIPLQLKTVVEFLNEQMNPAEVLAIEIKQYVGKGQKTLVPRVVGQTSKGLLKKSGAQSGRQWDEASLLQALAENSGNEDVAIAKKILTWSKERNLTLWFGKGMQMGSCFPMLQHADTWFWTFAVWTYGAIEIQFQWMKTRPVYDSETKRRELLKRLNQLPGVTIPEDGIERRPSIRFSQLTDESTLQKFFKIWEDYIEEIGSAV